MTIPPIERRSAAPQARMPHIEYHLDAKNDPHVIIHITTGGWKFILKVLTADYKISSVETLERTVVNKSTENIDTIESRAVVQARSIVGGELGRMRRSGDI